MLYRRAYVGVADKGRNLSIEIRHHAVLTTDKISFKLRNRGRTPHSKEKRLGAVLKLKYSMVRYRRWFCDDVL